MTRIIRKYTAFLYFGGSSDYSCLGRPWNKENLNFINKKVILFIVKQNKVGRNAQYIIGRIYIGQKIVNIYDIVMAR